LLPVAQEVDEVFADDTWGITLMAAKEFCAKK
jgi:hypothetical protein